MNSFTEDTIAAVATPSGVGAISVIRISGPDSFSAVDKIFYGKTKIQSAVSHTIHYGSIIDEKSELIDDVLISVFRAPHSYTGEDSVEISTHGNPFITERILNLLVENDIRMAEPGEFTKRAFMNGRLDLAQAEAVIDVINSRTEASLRGSRSQLDGLLSAKVNELRESIINVSSFIELELDFAEENIEFIDNKELLARIDNLTADIDNLLSTYSFGRIIKDGVNIALVGMPNVGKSSLLNYMLKESRAIVSAVPGTTRDVIREELSIDGILFRLYDTAGIRISKDLVEIEGVSRSREAIRNADVILFMNDVEQGLNKELYDEISSLSGKEKILIVMNKIDLARDNSGDTEAEVNISAVTGEGIPTLFTKLKEKALGSASYSEKSAVVSNLRHYDCLKKAKTNLLAARDSAEKNFSGEFIAVDLRNAASSLGEIIGAVTTEDILNNIFMKFCIGK
jgi:tRNA modification GTPase